VYRIPTVPEDAVVDAGAGTAGPEGVAAGWVQPAESSKRAIAKRAIAKRAIAVTFIEFMQEMLLWRE
jgi:hypothetical protein